MSADLLLETALAAIPKMLTLQDRDPHSPTHGCFDRNFWHYRIIDFSSGMAQEMVWPLALAWDTRSAANPYHGAADVRDAVQAGIRYAARSSRRDGSCDDYYPFERAAGAAAFSLLACIEAANLIELDDDEVRSFIERRAGWLAANRESGRLSNHEALIALCLERAGRRLGTDRLRAAAEERLERVLSWQDDEGWFDEYGGCDPGYLTLTISALAQLHETRPDARLQLALERAVRFAGELIHPDGSFGGEYGSRNTLAFFPDGFERVGRWMPEALALDDRFLLGLAGGRFACHDDDHLLGHHAWSFLAAFRNFHPVRPSPFPRRQGRSYYPNAGILIDRRGGRELYVGLHKGGVIKLFRDGVPALSDTQVSVVVGRGRARRNAVGHLPIGTRLLIERDAVTIEGRLGWAKSARMTPGRLVLSRIVMLTVGRFAPGLIRRLLQRMLITERRSAPFAFARRIYWDGEDWCVRDEVRARSWRDVVRAGIGAEQTSIYVAMSRTYRRGQSARWLDLTERVARLAPGDPLILDRRL